MKMFGIFSILTSILCFGGPVQAQENMIWSYNQFDDQTRNGRQTSTVSVGVPETDNIMLAGACAAGSVRGSSEVIFAAPVGNMAQGAQVSIRFSAGSYRDEYRGSASFSESGEGVAGVKLRLKNNDPLWDVMKDFSRIQYRVAGRTTTLTLRGSARAIGRFLNDCRFYANLRARSEPAPSRPRRTNDPRHATCDRLGNEISRNSDVPVNMTFINRTNEPRSVTWIGFDGVPKEYALLNPGQSYSINTFVSHPWMFTDAPGNCIEMFMPQQGVRTFEITAPSRYFGRE